MHTRDFIKVSIGTLLLSGIVFAQSGSNQSQPTTGGLGIWNLGWPPQLIVPPNTQPPKPEPLQKTVTMRAEEVCKGPGPTWFRVFTTETTYGGPNTFGPTIGETMEIDTGEKCQNRGSTRPDDSPAASPKSKYPVLSKIRGIGGGGGSPPPAGGGTGSGPHVVGLHSRAATPAPSAFQFVLPWRALPAPPLYDTADIPHFTVSCMSELHPTAFWIDHINGTATKEDMCTFAPLATFNITPNPLQVEVVPDGSMAVTTSYNSGITFIDTTTNQIVKTIQTDPSFTPSGLTISPDGSYALVTNYEPAGQGAELAVVDIASKSIVNTIHLDRDYPQSVYLNPDATLIWITYPFVNVVEVIDVMTGEVVHNLALESPCDITFNPTGTVAYIAGGESSGYLAVVNTQNYSTIKTVQAGFGACDVMLSPDELFISVNNYLANSITFINAVSFDANTVQAPGSPRGIALLPVK